jgi:FkbM family methyltransferase
VRERNTLSLLGAAAALARRARLGRAVTAVVDAADGVFLRARTPPLAARVEGLELRGYLRHRGFLEYVARGMPEETFYRSLVLDSVDSETTFVDAGAHIGVYTALTCRRAKCVVSFEPDPYNVSALERNIRKCGCDNVEIRAEALADTSGRATFRAFRSTFSGSLVPREVDDYREFETCVVSLDDALATSDPGPLVVKLDVEGAEPLALAGMGKTLREAPGLVIFVEVNPEALAAAGSSAQELIKDLLAARMECAFVDEDAQALAPLEAAPPGKGNVVCRKGWSRSTEAG